jgi:spermidine synthase
MIYALRERQHGLATAAGLAALLALGGTLATGPTAVWRHSGIGVGRAPRSDINAIRNWENRTRRNLLWDEDGRESSVAVTLPNDLAFVVNGKSDGSARTDAGTQVMSGIVGAMIHPNPKSAMVIGLGTGSTAGWLGAVKSIERVDSVELEPVVVDVAELCAPVNHNVLKNPRVHVELGDAREALLASRRTYDLIFSEPSNPYRAGIASLFTREFYEASAARLNRGGIFLQWIQAYGIDAETMRTVYATLHTVFPHIDSWWTSSGDLILAASREPHVYDVELIRRRLTEEPFRSAVHYTWRVESAEGFFSRFVASEVLGDAIAKETTTYNTDDRTVIEFGFARALGDNLFRLDEVFRTAQRLGATYPARVKGTLNRELIESNRATIGAIEPEGLRQRFAMAVELGNLDQALNLWNSQPWAPVNSRELASIGVVLAAAASASAEPYANALRPWSPIESDVILARLRFTQRRYPEAAELTKRAFVEYRRNPWPRPDIMARGVETANLLATVNPELARQMYELFSEPFILGQMHDERRKALVAMGLHADQCGPMTMKALLAFEPNPDWSAFGLQVRAACYARTQNSLAAAAAEDFERFLAAEPAPLVTRPPS